MEIGDNNETQNKELEKPSQQEECIELKNIKYKTMLINGVALNESKASQSIHNLDKFLENEKNSSENEPWCKLNKTIKIKKITEYVLNDYKKNNNLDETECESLITFLKDCLDRKKLQRIKDVIYDKENGAIKEIPALTYVKTTKHFTLKNIEKRISTLKSLPQNKSNKANKLANSHKTIKNKNDESDDETE
uniref:Uncharacterized protein n=1 Tax=viral metagenome TaxID=1070528 RepID=A0A6C0JKT2_9ZZZZ